MTRWARAGDPYSDPRWLAWCDGLEARIEAIRLEDCADRICSTCGSHVGVPHERLCGRCGETKPLTGFPRNRTEYLGRDFLCRLCKNASNKVTRSRRALKNIGRAS